jgi:hypothetical protein
MEWAWRAVTSARGPGSSRLGEQDRNRRLQGVSEVADVGALALHDFLIMVEQGVEFVG